MTALPFPPGSAIVAYLRDSGGSKQELSVDQQEAVIRDWCQNNDFVLSEVYADRAKPGGTIAGRIEFDRLIRHFQAGAPEAGVVCWDLSRWARNLDDGQFYLSSLRRLGYQVHSLEQAIPPGSIGRVVESLHLWSAEEYRRQLSHNVKRGLYYVVTVHHAYPRPNPPVGYRKEQVSIGYRRDGSVRYVSKLVVDPLVAPLVRKAFTMRASGYSIGEIHEATRLYNARSGYWRMFRNEIYLGKFNYGDLVIPDYCDPLVGKDTWCAIQEINQRWATWRTDQNSAAHPRRVKSPFLLSGLLRCSMCGKAMAGNHSKPRSQVYRYYTCTSNSSAPRRICDALDIRADELELKILELSLQLVSDTTVLQQLVDEVRAELAGREDDDSVLVERLETELDGVERAIRNLLDVLELSGASQALADRLRELEQQRSEINVKLDEARRILDARRGFDPSAAAAGAAEARISLDHIDPRKRQIALHSIIREIRATREGGVVVFNLPGIGTDTPVEFWL